MSSTSPRTLSCLLMASAVLIATGRPSAAGELCCCKCGKSAGVEKVCRVVVVEKKITINCWGCEAEEICLPGASRAACRHCELACDDEGDPCDHCSPLYRKWFVWADWTPMDCCWLPCGRPQIITKKKLMRKTVTRTVPAYKWVLEELCPDCEENCEIVNVPEGVLIPPAPKMDDARILTGKPPSAGATR